MDDADQPVFYSDGIDPVRRSSPDELFLVTIEARPEPDSDEHGVAGGAFVNCWVNAEDLRTAERRAIALIEVGGWRPHRFHDWELVTRATYEGREPPDGGPDLREVVEQAFIDGEVSVFNTWPRTGTDFFDPSSRRRSD
jgi:hypothetical protein